MSIKLTICGFSLSPSNITTNNNLGAYVMWQLRHSLTVHLTDQKMGAQTAFRSGGCEDQGNRVPKFAEALECDAAYFLRLALEQAEGSSAAKAIYEVVGDPITESERAWLAEIRDASSDTDPRPTTRSRSQLSEIFGK